MKALLTQFAHGHGAYLRVVELAIHVNREWERRGKGRLVILVPWIHGERQRQILSATFAAHEKRHPGEILLDATLGRLIEPFLYNETGFAASVALWVSGWEDGGAAVRAHLKKDLVLSDLSGRAVRVGSPTIVLELNRAPRLRIGVALAYQETCGRLSQLFGAMRDQPAGFFSLGPELIRAAERTAAEIERELRRTYVSVPGPFTSPASVDDEASLDVLIPPALSLPEADRQSLPPFSVYVTVSGAPVPAGLYHRALAWDLPLFTNDPERLGGGVYALPAIVGNPNVRFHYARAGWSSIWASLLWKKPILVPPFDRADDPEIFFNNEAVERWGLGRIDRDPSLKTLPPTLEESRPRLPEILARLEQRFGSLDGHALAAQRIVEDLLGAH